MQEAGVVTWAPSDSYAWLPVVMVGGAGGYNPVLLEAAFAVGIWNRTALKGTNFHVPAHAIVHCQTVRQPPGVLRVSAVDHIRGSDSPRAKGSGKGSSRVACTPW